MGYSKVNAKLTEEDVAEIKQAIALIDDKLPFLINLSQEERRRLFKMGDKSLGFVNNSVTAAQSNRDILPSSFDVEAFVSDYRMVNMLNDLLIELRQLSEKVDDTLIAIGSETMTNSLAVYDYVKTAAKNRPGLKHLAEQLGERFKAIRNKPPKSDSPG